MNDEHSSKKDDPTLEKLDEVIQKKKDEIASLQRLLESIGNHPDTEKDKTEETKEADATDNKDTSNRISK